MSAVSRASPEDQTFWIGRNPAAGGRLPYLLRLPVAGEGRLFLAARDTWPRSGDVFCYQLDEWPAEAEVVEEVPVEACWRVGVAVHLVLRRRQQRRSLFVWTKKNGRTLVFWRSSASMARARPGIRVPHARSFGERLTIAVDVGERYGWRFAGRASSLERRRLPVGDYALVHDDTVGAVIERKTVADLATSATSGQLALALADLGRTPHAALVIEGRFSDLLKAAKQGGVRPGWLEDLVAALQVAHPTVTWMFAETRALAEDWAFRWLGACARVDRPYAMPLLSERALGEPDFGAPPAGANAALSVPRALHVLPESPAPRALPGQTRPRLLDAIARRALLRHEADGGRHWTSREAAERCGVTPVTALADLNALVREGALSVVGRGRSRGYAAPAR